jgi:hypothetical protein
MAASTRGCKLVVLLANGVIVLDEVALPFEPLAVEAALTLAAALVLDVLGLAEDLELVVLLLLELLLMTFEELGVGVVVQYQEPLASAQAWPSLAIP